MSMGLLSDAKVVADWLEKLVGWWQGQRDPIRAQASRVLEVFENHGVTRTQISRLLPELFQIPMKNFASADKLKEQLTPALLDWVADFFALNRAWLDGVPVSPHQVVGTYKHPANLGAWLGVRRSDEPFQFRLLVLKPSAKPIGPESSETIVIALEEHVTFLDDQPICRYFVLDGNGPLDHYPVVRNLLGLCAVADRARCLVKGRVLSKSVCAEIEDGKLLIPAALHKSTGSWEPDVALFQNFPNESPWLKQLLADVAEDLRAANGP
ncbi:MAG: hypothetical protein WAZ34_00695 [Rhodocyclaceae bacterium]